MSWRFSTCILSLQIISGTTWKSPSTSEMWVCKCRLTGETEFWYIRILIYALKKRGSKKFFVSNPYPFFGEEFFLIHAKSSDRLTSITIIALILQCLHIHTPTTTADTTVLPSTIPTPACSIQHVSVWVHPPLLCLSPLSFKHLFLFSDQHDSRFSEQRWLTLWWIQQTPQAQAIVPKTYRERCSLPPSLCE